MKRSLRTSPSPPSASGGRSAYLYAIRAGRLAVYPAQQVGGEDVLELWIPAEDLDDMNRHIVGGIREIAQYGTAS